MSGENPSPPNDLEGRIRTLAEQRTAEWIALRRDLHAHPELAFAEHRTAQRVSQTLTALGIPHRCGVGQTGVVGVIDSGRPGPTLLIRADMDALPIEERTGLPFASRSPGLMHACGHDIHTVTLLGTAALLKELSPAWRGRAVLVFQPAEETLAGAKAMIEAGLLEETRPDAALGFHNHPTLPVGRFGYAQGAALAASDRFTLTLRGRSGHAAHPHLAVDPIVAAAHFITAAQSFVAREVNPLEPAVVTVGAIAGGTVHNIIPDEVVLRGTVRTLSAAVRDQAEAALRRLAGEIGAAFRVTPDLFYERLVPPLRNHPALEPVVERALCAQFGAPPEVMPPSMGSEDFALFTERVPGFQLRIGSGAPGRHDHLHSSEYQPGETCIPLGVQALVRIACEFLS